MSHPRRMPTIPGRINYTEKMKRRLLTVIKMEWKTTVQIAQQTIGDHHSNLVGQYLRLMAKDGLIIHRKRGIMDQWQIKEISQ